ncbi:hypothetical protein Q5752_004593 [Cryptotrichosporon argae]
MRTTLQRTPSSDGESSTSKRPRLFRACQQCVSAKTRCEEVKPGGCRGCRKKNKECSLAGTVLASDSRRSSDRLGHGHGSGFRQGHGSLDGMLAQRVGEAEERAAVLESRVAVLERQVLHQTLATPAAGAGATPVETPHVNLVDVPVRHPLFDPILSVRVSDNSSATFFGAYGDEPYPDPVALGLVSQDQVDMAFQLFKHRICDILPLEAFALSSTPTPRHPFVVLAFLQHVPSLLTPALCTLVHRSVALAMAGAISADVMFGLLILAVAPEPAMDDRPRASPTRLISLARDIGIQLELDDSVGRHRVANVFAVQDIWRAVCSKYIILHACQAQIGSILHVPRSITAQTPDEAALLALVFRAVEVIHALKHDYQFEGDMHQVRDEWLALGAELSALRGRLKGSLFDDATAITFAMYLRVSIAVHDIPSPLLAIRTTLRECSHGMPAVMRPCLQLAVGRDAPMPAHIAHTVAAAIIAARRTIAVVIASYTEVREPIISYELVEQAEAALLALGGAPARLVRSALHHLGPVAALREMAAANAVNATPADPSLGIDLNWLFWEPALFQMS